jgi:hypothetical protein
MQYVQNPTLFPRIIADTPERLQPNPCLFTLDRFPSISFNNIESLIETLFSFSFLFTYIPCFLILSNFIFNLPTDAQLNCLKNNFKIYFKIYIKTAPTCFGVITIIRERKVRSC